MVRFVIVILALGAALIVATVLGAIAHGLGIPRGTIRLDALISAAFMGIALASTTLQRNK
jgi:hypothetical protein